MPHTIHRRDGHLGWDRDRPAAVTVAPGDTVEVVAADAADGQLAPDSDAVDVTTLDPGRVNPLTGPIAVDGADPGDTLAVTLLDQVGSGWGWTAIIPGFGLLTDDFPRPHLVHSRYDEDHVELGGFALLAATPFVGTIGVAPAEPGTHDVIPPRRVGGNLDLRDVGPGATILLPVEVGGALLSLGDTHAAQGDGEVCGTAVETAATVPVRVELLKDRPVPAPQVERARPAPRGAAGPVLVTTGVGPDLHAGAVDATRAMVEHLSTRHRLPPEDAYVLCSVAAHLRIGEVVDAPNWVVAMELDLSVLG